MVEGLERRDLLATLAVSVPQPEYGEGQEVSFTIHLTDAPTELVGVPWSVSGLENPSGWVELSAAYPSATVQITTPDNDNENADYWLELSASYESSVSSASTWIINDDHAPVFSASSYSFEVPENSLNGTPVGVAAASDEDDDALVYTVSGGPFFIDSVGAIYVGDGAVLDFETNAGYELTVEAFDGHMVSTVSVNVIAADVNEAPAFDAASYSFSVAENSTGVIGALSATDPDSDTLTYAIVSGLNIGDLQIDAASGAISAAPNATLDFETTPSYEIVVQVTDGVLTSEATVSIVVADVEENVAPVFAAPSYSFTVAEESPAGTSVGTVAATDANGDPLTYLITTGNSNGFFTINAATGEISVAEGAALDFESQPIYELSVVVGDGQVAAAVGVTILLGNLPENQVPTAGDDWHDVPYVAAEGRSVLTLTDPGVLLNDNDPENAPLTVILLVNPTHGSLVWNPTGGFTYTAEIGYSGPDWFAYRVSDGEFLSNTATVDLTILASSPPVAVNDEYTLDEDGVLTVDAANGLLSNDTDPDGDPLTVSLVTNLAPTHGTLVLYADGSLTYTPHANFFGTDSFGYLVSDGALDSTIAMVSINVSAVNDAPVADAEGYQVNEDESIVVASPGLLSNDIDIDGEELTAILVTDPNHGIVDLQADGSFSYTPNVDFNGDDSFAYYSSDGIEHSQVITVAVSVVSVNDPPVAIGDVYYLSDMTLTVSSSLGVLANDFDTESNELSAILVNGPAHGSVDLAGDGSFIYAPGPGFVGTDSFTYRTSDQDSVSRESTVYISAVMPFGVSDTYWTVNDQVLVVVPEDGVLKNDLIDPQSPSVISVATSPEHGTLALNSDGSFSLTFDQDFFGNDSFEYVITSLSGMSAPVFVSVNRAKLVIEYVQNGTGVSVESERPMATVGQKVLLRAKLLDAPAGAVLTKRLWGISSTKTVKGYPEPTNVRSEPDFTEVNEFIGNEAQFYWVVGGEHQIGFKATPVSEAGALPEEVTVFTFNVLRPDETIAVVNSGMFFVGDENLGGGAAGGAVISFGNYGIVNASPEIAPTPGIMFIAEDGNQSDSTSGEYAFVQTGQFVATTVLTVGGIETTVVKRTVTPGQGRSFLDVSFPYATLQNAPTITTDSPFWPLLPAFKSVKVEDKFAMFLMFKPTGPDSIWVPLQVAQWSLTLSAVKAGVLWDISGSSVTASETGVDTIRFPRWEPVVGVNGTIKNNTEDVTL